MRTDATPKGRLVGQPLKRLHKGGLPSDAVQERQSE
jgi:hypothetical protein